MRRLTAAKISATLIGAALLTASCTVIPGLPEGAPDGFVDAPWSRDRQDEFLHVATAARSPGSPLNVIAHAERAAREADFPFDATGLTPEAYADSFARIDTMEDTTDFTMLYLLNLWYGYRDRLPVDLRAAIEQRILAFKYWYDEPTPPGIIDDKIYWTENHRLIFHVIEYLAGQAFPVRVFTNDGKTGAEHRDHAAGLIDEWLAEKARFGFTEWHSDVYYQKDATPLLSLVEWAKDFRLARRASMLLDVLLYDLALHVQRGNNGATHGRSYMKDKSTAIDQDVFGITKLLFDDTPVPYRGGDDAAVLFARARRYRMPQAILRVARSVLTTVDRERMNVPFDPQAPITPNPEAPYGISFDDPANLSFWWERGAQTIWQGIPLTLATADQYNLWETEQFKPFVGLRDLTGGDVAASQTLAHALAPMLSFAVLSEVNTYTYRSPSVMLSTAQSYRPGVFGEQHHLWQATLDDSAIVFTTQPKNVPQVGSAWPDDDGYWTGSGSMPRSAQHGTVGIHLYAPQFVSPTGPPLDHFTYLPQTHAYFPREKFDEVVQSGKWTFGRRGDGYVALWSWRPTHWRAAQPGEFTHGLTEPFDLVADGGANDVWIVEVGDRARWKSFAGFRAAITAAPIAVADRGSAGGISKGFDVRYQSPAQGEMKFGWTGPLSVRGRTVAIDDYPRFENPWSRAPFDSRTLTIADSGWTVGLDFDHWTRTVRAPRR
jgi:hypothetical protein